MTIQYRIYQGDSSGGPVDYTSIVTSTTSLSAALSPLSPGTTTKFGVRAYDTVSGVEEKNTDATVEITVDGSGDDATNRPYAPAQLRVFAGPGGTATVEWSYPYLDAARLPTGFRVYVGTPSVSYASPAATVAWGGGGPRPRTFRASLSGLSDGVSYQVGVRAYNASGEEPNATVATVVGRSTAPASVDGLASSLGV